jgi:hypothetical protein
MRAGRERGLEAGLPPAWNPALWAARLLPARSLAPAPALVARPAQGPCQTFAKFRREPLKAGPLAAGPGKGMGGISPEARRKSPPPARRAGKRIKNSADVAGTPPQGSRARLKARLPESLLAGEREGVSRPCGRLPAPVAVSRSAEGGPARASAPGPKPRRLPPFPSRKLKPRRPFRTDPERPAGPRSGLTENSYIAWC